MVELKFIFLVQKLKFFYEEIFLCFDLFMFICFLTLDKCVYKEKIYQQGDTWVDGCEDACECHDAKKGQYRCHTRYEKIASTNYTPNKSYTYVNPWRQGPSQRNFINR